MTHMLSRLLPPMFICLILLGLFPSGAQAQMFIPDENTSPLDETFSQGGFTRPYEYERKAYGYDPEGMTYRENKPEDFQVIFITSTPFTAGGSFLLTGLTSAILNGSFQVGGDYFIPFIALTLAGSTTIACVSVLSNKYPPPQANLYLEGEPRSRDLAWKLPLVTARF